MPNSTSPTAPCFSIVARDLRSEPDRTYRRGHSDFCSAAGLQRRPWLSRLRRALREDRFVLHYQPIVSLQSGRASHYEALVRLADEPEGRLVSPGDFLPAAERYGLVRELDRLVASKVIALLGEQPPESEVRIALNLSALSLTDNEMLAHLESELARHEVSPDRLVIEVTETAAISDIGIARSFCERASTLGASIALDDFGVGFGSFYYVKHLPFDYLKIDGEFIRALPDSPRDQLLVRALVDVARGMGKRTIAEFVTDAPTIKLLRGLGVDYAQGFEIGRPLPVIPPDPALALAA